MKKYIILFLLCLPFVCAEHYSFFIEGNTTSDLLINPYSNYSDNVSLWVNGSIPLELTGYVFFDADNTDFLGRGVAWGPNYYCQAESFNLGCAFFEGDNLELSVYSYDGFGNISIVLSETLDYNSSSEFVTGNLEGDFTGLMSAFITEYDIKGSQLIIGQGNISNSSDIVFYNFACLNQYCNLLRTGYIITPTKPIEPVLEEEPLPKRRGRGGGSSAPFIMRDNLSNASVMEQEDPGEDIAPDLRISLPKPKSESGSLNTSLPPQEKPKREGPKLWPWLLGLGGLIFFLIVYFLISYLGNRKKKEVM